MEKNEAGLTMCIDMTLEMVKKTNETAEIFYYIIGMMPDGISINQLNKLKWVEESVIKTC